VQCRESQTPFLTKAAGNWASSWVIDRGACLRREACTVGFKARLSRSAQRNERVQGVEAQLPHDVCAVAFRRLYADGERGCDFLAGLALSKKLTVAASGGISLRKRSKTGARL